MASAKKKTQRRPARQCWRLQYEHGFMSSTAFDTRREAEAHAKLQASCKVNLRVVGPYVLAESVRER